VNRVRFVQPARLEVLAEVAYYHRLEAGLGTKFLEAVEDATARALAYPLGPRQALLAICSVQNPYRRIRPSNPECFPLECVACHR
jgi:hypothetical protein